MPLDSSSNTENVKELPFPLLISAVYWGYLPQDTLRNLDDRLLKDLQAEKYLLIFLKRKYWLVFKSEVEVEKW